LRDHTRRLFDSAKIYRIAIPFSQEQINEACRQVVSANSLARGAYIRPIVFRGYGEVAGSPQNDPPVRVALPAWEWGKYLGHESEELGVDVCVSSWNRVAPNTIPALAKAGQLSLEPADRRGSTAAGIRGRHWTRSGWHRERGLRREPVRDQGRSDD